MISKLDAVNQILSVTGDAAVTNISSYEQSIIANRILEEVSTEKQTKGWWFNESDEVELTPDGSNEVNLPSSVIRCEIPNDDGVYVQRGLKIFNKKTQSFDLSELNGEKLMVNIVSDLDWEYLPQSFRQFVLAHAKLRYNNEYFGSAETQRTVERDVLTFSQQLEAEDIDNRDLNVFRSQRAYNIAFRNRR